MNNGNIYIHILVMAIATYLVRALPMTVIRGEIKNRFIKSFLHYVPFATIASMIIPDAFHCTASMGSAIIGIIISLYLSYKEKDLIVVCLFACIAVYFSDLILALE